MLCSPGEIATELLRLAYPQLNAIEAQASDARRAIAGGDIPESRSVKETNTLTSSVRRGPDAFDETINADRAPVHRSRVPWIAAAALLGGAIAYGVFSGSDERVAAPSPSLTRPPIAPTQARAPVPVTGTEPSEPHAAPVPRPRKFHKAGESEPAAVIAEPTPTVVPAPATPSPPPPRPTLTDNPC